MESLLIVDDEVIIADGLYHMLQEVFQDRLEVRRCYSCDEACAVLNRNRVDILLTDIEMPGASGLELHRMVRERWPMTRVIYLTGYSDFDYARRALKQRAFAYVLKSEGDQVIISTVERAVENLQEESARLMRQAAVASEYARQLRQLVFHAMHADSCKRNRCLPPSRTAVFPLTHIDRCVWDMACSAQPCAPSFCISR